MSLPYIITDTNITVLIDGAPVSCTTKHPNHQLVIDAIRNQEWHKIRSLISSEEAVKTFVAKANEVSPDVTVDFDNEVVMYKGNPIHGTVVDRVVHFAREGLDVAPLLNFITNLYQNPSMTAVDELYGFLQKSSMPITEDGHFLAYKRVRQDYTSVYDGKFMNKVGTVVSMPRNRVNDNRDQTCSDGLHFCSFSYLAHFGGGRTLILKINPRDVVSIPSDYNDAKGRACAYEIFGEVQNDSGRDALSESPEVVTKMEQVPTAVVVVPEEPIIEHTSEVSPEETPPSGLDGVGHDAFVQGYDAGYRCGRNKKAAPPNPFHRSPVTSVDWAKGFTEGRADGKAHARRRYILE